MRIRLIPARVLVALCLPAFAAHGQAAVAKRYVNLCVGPSTAPVSRVLGSRALRFFGKYSYALNVVHPVVGYLVPTHGVVHSDAAPFARPAYFVTMLVGSVAASVVSWNVLERPILSLKRFFEAPARRRRPCGRDRGYTALP